MKGSISTALALLLFAIQGFGFVIWHLEAPRDDHKMREAALHGPAVQAFADRFNTIQERRLWPLDVSAITAALGPKLDADPVDRVLPLFEGDCLALSGLFSRDEPDKRHVDFIRIADVGYLELHYHRNGQKLEAAVLWFQPDALKSLDDLTRRLDWELRRFELFQKWLDQNLPI